MTTTPVHPPLEELVSDFDDPTADKVTDSISTLLALATSGHPDALAEARRRFEGLHAYLSAGNTPLPAQWSHAIAWRSPDHDPVIEADVNATYATQPVTPEPPTVDDAIVVDEDDQFGFDFTALTNTPDPSTVQTQPQSKSHPDVFTVFPSIDVTGTDVLDDEPDDDIPNGPMPATTEEQGITHLVKRVPLFSVRAYGPGTPLADIQRYIDERIDDGVTCPACEATVKVRSRTIRAELAMALTVMWHAGNRSQRDWFRLPEIRTWKSRDESFLASFGLIEAQTKVLDKGKRGWWRLTPLGEEFVTRQVKIRTYADVFRSKTRRLHGDWVSIDDCLQKEWDYSLLMANPNHL